MGNAGSTDIVGVPGLKASSAVRAIQGASGVNPIRGSKAAAVIAAAIQESAVAAQTGGASGSAAAATTGLSAAELDATATAPADSSGQRFLRRISRDELDEVKAQLKMTHKFHHGIVKGSYAYKCRAHLDCPHEFRIKFCGENEFDLFEKFSHSQQPATKGRGIHPLAANMVSTMIEANMEPRQIVRALQELGADESVIPTLRQVANYKRTVRDRVHFDADGGDDAEVGAPETAEKAADAAPAEGEGKKRSKRAAAAAAAPAAEAVEEVAAAAPSKKRKNAAAAAAAEPAVVATAAVSSSSSSGKKSKGSKAAAAAAEAAAEASAAAAVTEAGDGKNNLIGRQVRVAGLGHGFVKMHRKASGSRKGDTWGCFFPDAPKGSQTKYLNEDELISAIALRELSDLESASKISSLNVTATSAV